MQGAAMPKSIHRPEYTVLRDLVREIRVGANVTQTELSAQLGRSQSFVSDVERGIRRLDILELRDVCRLLGQPFLEVVAELDRRMTGQRHKKGTTRSGSR